jgi:hypothetical protein
VLLAWEAQLPPGEVPVPQVQRKLPAAEPMPRPGALVVRVGASAQAWLSSALATWGAAGSVELRQGPWGAELTVFGQGQRQVALGDGRATWSRLSVALGPTASLKLAEKVELSLDAAAVAGPFWVSGSRFEGENAAVLDWDFGVTAGARLFLPGFQAFRPFLGLSGVAWVRRHEVRATRPAAAAVLPFLEASPTLGLAFTP